MSRAALSQLRLDLAPAPTPPAGVRGAKPERASLRRVTVMPNEAAAMLGVSRGFFDEHVRPELGIIGRGSKTILIPVAELERWVEQSAARWAS